MKDKLSYDRKWRELNRDKVRASQKRYKDANPLRTKQQRQVSFKRYYDKNKEVQRERVRKYSRTIPKERILLNGARTRAKLKGLAFDLVIEDITIPKVCPVLGIPIQAGEGKLSPNSPSLDRIVPSEGYIKGNICVISHKANSVKSNGSIEEHEAIIKYMKKHLDK